MATFLRKCMSNLAFRRCISFTSKSLEEKLNKHGITPDFNFDFVPQEFITVKYASGLDAELGNSLTPTATKKEPTLTFKAASPDTLHTLSFIDLDAPSRMNPKHREWDHWLVVNIPGNDISKGDHLSEYVPAAPKEGTGYHRFVFLVFEQPHKITNLTKTTSAAKRGKFSIKKFLAANEMDSHPLAVNFFYASWDPLVPIIYRRLGLNKLRKPVDKYAKSKNKKETK